MLFFSYGEYQSINRPTYIEIEDCVEKHSRIILKERVLLISILENKQKAYLVNTKKFREALCKIKEINDLPTNLLELRWNFIQKINKNSFNVSGELLHIKDNKKEEFFKKINTLYNYNNSLNLIKYRNIYYFSPKIVNIQEINYMATKYFDYTTYLKCQIDKEVCIKG